MPGTVSDIKVAVGDTVSNGQVLCVLEAMKMENDIASPAAGKILAVHVAKGASVNSDDLLFTIG
jgi:biotin carboxyl carrier protein